MKDKTLRYVLAITHLATCNTLTDDMTKEKRKALRETLSYILKMNFTYGDETKVCLNNLLNETLYDLFCDPERDANMEDALDFTIYVTRISIDEGEESNLTKAILLGAEYLQKTKAYKNFNPTCPKKKLVQTKIRPMKTRRQFGVKDMMHTLVLVFCDPDVMRGYAEELKRRRPDKSYLAWATFVFGKGFCCVIEGEWHKITKG